MAREKARDREFDFEKSVRSQIAMLRELCYGMNLPVTVEGRILRVEPTPEALEAQRLKREEAKARRKAERAARLAFIEEHYGKYQAEAFAALSGWR